MLKEHVELNYGNGKIYIPEVDDMEIIISDEEDSISDDSQGGNQNE